MQTSNWLPITYVDLQEDTIRCLMFSDVEFTENFGPWKNGQKIDTIMFDFWDGEVTSYDLHGQKLLSFNLILACGSKKEDEV